ncbi:MAG TPA: ATP-binding protein, partial [Puia sp.]|nr:ATP-binding protein [Puia sp.]
ILQRELQWLSQVMDTRMKLYFGNECDYVSVFNVMPVEHPEEDAPYVRFLNHYKMNLAERIVLMLALVPHICPQVLDQFWAKNTAIDRGFTEFGGLKGTTHGGFLPTGETALFLLAGNELKHRFAFTYLFEGNHFFSAHEILKLMPAGNGEPVYSGAMQLSKEFIDQFTTGRLSKPNFSIDFPAKLISTQLEWEDLVLPEKIHEQIDEIKAWVKHAATLMHDWDMGKKLKPGFKTLFYGPSGTGKTLTACLIGKHCNMDVYRIDLSMMVSKYIGETEKNLSKVFDMAEHKNWILFFDEADALFGKRTGVSDSHDRYANQEVSYLLQRIEDFNGVVILCTNLKSNIDEAFTRRFQSIIYFPMPGEEQRFKIWENAFPKITTREDKLDMKQIASRYELTGGTIMNVVRYSSLMALNRNEKEIKLFDIEQGIKKEFMKEGKLV